LREIECAGKVDIAADRHCRSRDAQLFATRTVEIVELVHGRHLAQQRRVIGTPLVERAGAGARHPTDLALGVGKELFDAARADVRLLGHCRDQRRFGLAVDEPGLDRAIDDQNNQHKPDEIDHVLGEQTAITDPARLLLPLFVLHRGRFLAWFCGCRAEPGPATVNRIVHVYFEGLEPLDPPDPNRFCMIWSSWPFCCGPRIWPKPPPVAGCPGAVPLCCCPVAPPGALCPWGDVAGAGLAVPL